MTTHDVHLSKREIFLQRLAETGQVTSSAKDAGLGRRFVYTLKDKHPEFAEAWEDAEKAYADSIEAEAHRRAVTGTKKGIWHQGAHVGDELQYSDSLLALMLKAKKREYRDKVELGNADDKPLKVEESPTQIGRKIAFALAVALRAKEQEAAATGDDGSDMV